MKIVVIECDAEELKANRGIMDAIVDALSVALNSFYGTYTPASADAPESEEENND